MTDRYRNKGVSVLRDVGFAVLGILLFLAVLAGVNWVHGMFNVPQVFNVVGWVGALTSALVASAIAFVVLKVGFRQTLGGDLGEMFDKGWEDMLPRERTRWMIGAFLVLVFAILTSGSAGAVSVRKKEVPSDQLAVISGERERERESAPAAVGQGLGRDAQATVPGLALPVSVEARDLIIRHEVGGRSYYESRLAGPTVPGWQTTVSGVTVGFGFDVGHNSPAQIRRAWTGVIPAAQVEALVGAAGKKGADAYYNALPAVRHTVRVSWDQATVVFERDSLPRYTKQTADAFRLAPGRLHAHSNGALVSLVFNRGPSMAASTSRQEMRWIRDDIAAGYAGRVPGHIQGMKRIWAGRNLAGLLRRRDDEAALFRRGLRAK